MRRLDVLSIGALVGLLPPALGTASCGGPARPADARLRTVIGPAPDQAEQGEVVRFTAEVRRGGERADGVHVFWRVNPGSGGEIRSDGRFVGYEPGNITVIATPARDSGVVADSVHLTISPRSTPTGRFTVVGHGRIEGRLGTDLWAFGDIVLTGTRPRGGVDGNLAYVWDIRDFAAPRLVDSVVVEAGQVNDVKIAPDGGLAALSREGAPDSRNGITLLDLSDPFHPTVVSTVTEGMEPGVHNLWLEAGHAYVVVDGTDPSEGAGLRIVDISDPTDPRSVAHFWGGGSFLHDVYVRDGLAFLSHWDEGLIILDVGAGIAGGSPADPVEVGRMRIHAGNVHNAWYWPETGYVFVGEEDFGRPGVVHVVDAGDLSGPEVVATYAVPDVTPHNFWMDEERSTLYVGWYEAGVVAIDVSGELLGRLDRQGREIAAIRYDGPGGCGTGRGTCAWAPQLHRDLLWVADMNSGLWVLEPGF